MSTMIFLWLVMCFPMFFWANCPCCGSTDTTCSDCSATGAYSCYEFTIAGVTDNGCSSCTNLNGTWQVSELFTCYWEGTYSGVSVENVLGGCASDRLQFNFSFITSQFELNILSGTALIAKYVSDDNDCSSSSWSYSYSFDDGGCNYPSSITLAPC